MQLYALDENNAVIFAKNAVKHHNYICLECQSILRLRGGIHRQNHFYHIDPSRACRQSGKSMEHLQVQIFLHKLLTENDCALEKHFKEINRIADVVWFSKKIIFEVQCSFISLDELKNRNRDYAFLGFSVVWILHERQFNQLRLSAVEKYLQTKIHYYTNMDALGKGEIYDMFRLFERGREIFKTNPFHVRPELILENKTLPKNKQIPNLLLKKINTQSFYFKGDLIDYCHSDSFCSTFFANALIHQSKAKTLSFKYKLLHSIDKLIFRPYRIIFRMLLERAIH